ncbi:MAG TPA: NAD(P)/FAD-dependent oxidoreductase [Rhizomicrobium sp.]|nr:NAD(P)/FAD-dependent oxidoreductase [Rhizomicrobium sp.]
MSAAESGTSLPRVVIVGAGFGGLWAAKTLARARADVFVIDRQNYHLFQPLLYQVATAELSPADIAAPIRHILSPHKNITVLMGEVNGIDVGTRTVMIEGGRSARYDFLVLATGARHSYFGHGDWESFAPGLKLLEDATDIRRRILIALERAESESDPGERRRLMNIVIVGGGPTGVEMAGATAELVRYALAKDFRNIDPRAARIILVEAGPRLLPILPPDLSDDARRRLERLGVEVRLDAPVTRVDDEGVLIGTERIEARTVVWAAGVLASPAADWIGAEHDRVGRILINSDMTVPNHPEIFVIGDTSRGEDAAGNTLPGMAAVAKQQGIYVGHAIGARIRGAKSVKPFRYRNYGNFATIGRNAAVIDLGWIHLRGQIAWVAWSIVHIYFLMGFRNRMTVALQWLWDYLTFQRGARLIVGQHDVRELDPKQ